MTEPSIDHLFRHQFGKMVSILTRIFGFQHLETIEDAIQDTFVQAIKVWRNGVPNNPEAWLTAAAKNRVIDIFRSINAEKIRTSKQIILPLSLDVKEFFLDHEIEDSQLRMIFTACHPKLAATEQIAFALRALSGFSIREIASALMTKEETIKKRLTRARKIIISEKWEFEIPRGEQLTSRLDRVLEVIYVLFNEGFHSNKQDYIIRKDLCGEALRLAKILLKKKALQLPKVYALFALMCFHSARLDSKSDANNELINLRDQDRTKWFFPLTAIGNEAMFKAVEGDVVFTSYHYEAAIAAEHLKASSFEKTNWTAIADFYEKLIQIQPTSNFILNAAIVYIQLNKLDFARSHLQNIDPKTINHQVYLYHATLAEYYFTATDSTQAIEQINIALDIVAGTSEQNYLESKKQQYKNQS